MKRMICGLTAAMLVMANLASAGQPGGTPASEKSVMLYISKPVGLSARGRQQPLSFGVRLQQGTPLSLQRAVPLVDFRYRADGRRTMSGAGVLMLDSFGSGSDSFSEHPFVWALAAGGVVAGLACILNAGICDGSSGGEYEPPTG